MSESHRNEYELLQCPVGLATIKVVTAAAMLACKPFGLSLAAALLDGKHALEDAQSSLDDLTKVGLLFQTESGGGEIMWRFTSPSMHSSSRAEIQAEPTDSARMMASVRVALKTQFSRGSAASREEINNLLDHAAELLRGGAAEEKWSTLAEWLLDRAAERISQLGFHDSALKCLAIVDEWFSTLPAELSSSPAWKTERLSLLSRRADLLTASGSLADAIRSATEAVELAGQLVASDTCPSALQRRKNIVEKLAELHTVQGNHAEAQSGYSLLESLDGLIATKSSTSSPARNLSAIKDFVSRGNEKFRRFHYYAALTDYAEARRLAEQACLADNAGPQENEVWFSTLLKLGRTHAALHQHPSARECFEEASSIAGEFSKHPAEGGLWETRLCTANVLLGDVYLEEGNAAAAIPVYARCLELEEKASAPSGNTGRFEISALLLKLATAHAQSNALEKARENVERACAIRTAMLAESPHDLERTRALMVAFTQAGSLLVASNNVEQATAQFEAALNIAEDLCTEAPADPTHQADRAVLREQLALLRV